MIDGRTFYARGKFRYGWCAEAARRKLGECERCHRPVKISPDISPPMCETCVLAFHLGLVASKAPREADFTSVMLDKFLESDPSLVGSAWATE